MRGHCKKHHGCHGWDGRTLRDAPGLPGAHSGFLLLPKDRCRLLALGLTPGVTAEISPSGCLRVRDADIVLGDDLAATITVQPLPEDARA
jgi:ferrous iron transport protein A